MPSGVPMFLSTQGSIYKSDWQKPVPMTLFGFGKTFIRANHGQDHRLWAHDYPSAARGYDDYGFMATRSPKSVSMVGRSLGAASMA